MGAILKWVAVVVLCFGISVLTGCSDNKDSSELQTGTFVDAPVANINFRTATQSGFTDTQGRFSFFIGERVTFSFGNITLPPVTAKNVVTPVDIAQETDSNASINSPVAVNIARLLQSVDADGNPDNGIEIPAGANASVVIDFTADRATFEAAFSAGFPDQTLVSESQATTHLQEQIDELDRSDGGAGTGSSAQICPLGGDPSTVSVLPGALASQVVDLVVTTANTGSPVALDQLVNFTFSSSGTLFVDDVDVSDAPYQCPASTAEFLWFDQPNNIIYAVAVIDGVLHEVSVLDDTGTFFASLETQTGTDGDSGGGSTVSFAISGSIVNPDTVSGQWELFIGSNFNNDGSLATISAITFSSGDIADGAAYEVRPSSADCTVVNGTGTVSGANVTDVVINCAAPATNNNPPATVNSSLVGAQILVFREVASGSPFSDKQEVLFTIGSDNSLSFKGTILTKPFFKLFSGTPNEHEVIWVDAATDVEYALSDNLSGNFNEINISKNSTFLGQFKEAQQGPETLLPPLANDYSAEIYFANGGRSGGQLINFFIPDVDIGSNLDVAIADTGVITVAGGVLVFDPSDSSYEFFDNTNSVSPRVAIAFTDSNDVRFLIEIYIEDGAAVRFDIIGPQSQRLKADIRPLSSETTAMLARLRALGEQRLTLVTDSTSYNSVANAVLGTPFQSASVCQVLVMNAVDPDSTDQRDDLSLVFNGNTISALGLVFELGKSRYFSESGDEILTFNGAQLTVAADDSTDLGFGFLSVGSKRLETVLDSATNVVASVDARCSDFYGVGGTINGAVGIAIDLELVDADTGTQLVNYFGGANLVMDSATANFSGQAESGTNYEVRISSLNGQFTSTFCGVSNGSGTVGSADINDVVVDCGDTPPVGTFQISGTFPANIFASMTINGSSSVSIRTVTGQVSGGDYAPIRGLVDGSTYSISAPQCLNEPITGTIIGADQVVNIVCDI